MKLFVLILTVLAVNVSAWGGYKINFEYNDLEFDESLLNMEIQTKQFDHKTVVNVRSELYEDINEPIIINVAHFEKVNDEYEHLVNSSVSACTIMRRFSTHPIMKLIMKELLKASNLPTQCPVQKGIYFMKDFSLNDDLLPPFLPTGNFLSKIDATRVIGGKASTIYKMTVSLDIEHKKERSG